MKYDVRYVRGYKFKSLPARGVRVEMYPLEVGSTTHEVTPRKGSAG